MADIPLISTTPGAATDAPDAVNNTINPAVVSLNTLNDTTIPALQAINTSQSAAITALQGQVGGGEKISQLTGGVSLQTTDEIPITRAGNNFSLPGSAFSAASTHVFDFSTVAGYNNTGLVGISAA